MKDVKTVARRVENLLSYGKNHYGEYASEESINKIKISDIEELYLNRFYPQNAYVIIVGDIDFKIAKKLTQRILVNGKKEKLPNQYLKPQKI